MRYHCDHEREEVDVMAQLIVRNLDDALVRNLKRRAAEHGHSAEEEHREILRQGPGVAVAPAIQRRPAGDAGRR